MNGRTARLYSGAGDVREDSNVLMIDTVEVGLQDESRVADLPSGQIRQPTIIGAGLLLFCT